MNKKEQAKRKNRVTPRLRKRKEVKFSELSVGDCCIDASNDLLIKTDTSQDAVSLVSGLIYNNMCDCHVRPVDVKINWVKKQWR